MDAGVFQQLAGALFFSDPRLRAPEAELLANQGSQPMLWAIGVSGDWPILLATIDSTDGLPTLGQLLSAHQYWRRRGMLVDLVILNTRATSYADGIGDQVTATVLSSSEAGMVDRPGGVFLRRRDLLGPAELRMLRATARVHLPCDGRRLGSILESLTDATEAVKELRPLPRRPLQRTIAGLVERLRVPAPVASVGQAPERSIVVDRAAASAEAEAATPLLLDNGLGGLDPDGAYRIRLGGTALPPAPWANVVANPEGGFLVSERGAGFSWAGSSFFYRLTPWHNDPVTDPTSDVLYLRDEDTGELWTPTPAPIRHASSYRVRHEAGASTFEHRHSELESVLTIGLAEGSATRILATAPDQPRFPAAPHRGDRLRGVDARKPARAHPAPDPHRVRRRPGNPVRPEHVRPSVRRVGGVLRADPRGARAHRPTAASSSAAMEPSPLRLASDN